MPTERLRKIVRLEALAGFILLLVACGLAVLASYSSRDASNLVNRSLHVRHALSTMFGELRDAETGQRGHLLTGRALYLQTYARARTSLEASRTELRLLTADNPAQRKLLGELDPLVDRKLAELARTVQLQQENDQQAALAMVKSGQGIELMDRIRKLVRQMDDNQSSQEEASLRRAHVQQNFLLCAIIATTLLASLLAALVVREEARQRHELEFKNAVLEEQLQQQRITEAKLRQAQKMEAIGQLTGGIAHDFNNMLAVVVGNIELSLRRMEKGMEAGKFIQSALSGATKAAELTKRLLAFSRRQALHPSTVDVNGCVQEMSAILSRTLGENITIDLALSNYLWNAYVDRSQLESAILNLAVNSRDAMESQGRLTIETANVRLDENHPELHEGATPGEYVMVAVSDTGNGMTQEVLHKAFEPFFTTKASGHGTGLGLSQILGFLKQSKGHIKIDSEVGVGTTVKLYLPRAETSNNCPVFSHVGEVSALPHTVLVVEDDAEVRAFVMSALQELGYTALQADKAKTAERLLDEHPDVSILLTDVVMPGMSGVELANMMTKRHPELRVLLMSGYARDIVERAPPRYSRMRLITKPFTLRELAQALRATLNDYV